MVYLVCGLLLNTEFVAFTSTSEEKQKGDFSKKCRDAESEGFALRERERWLLELLETQQNIRRVYFRSMLIKLMLKLEPPPSGGWKKGSGLLSRATACNLWRPTSGVAMNAACSVSWYTFGVTTIIWHVWFDEVNKVIISLTHFPFNIQLAAWD